MKKFGLVFAVATLIGCSSSSGNGIGASDTPDASASGNASSPGSGSDASAGGDATADNSDAGTKKPTKYDHVVIDFDDLEDGTPITNQYAVHATFSASADCANETSANYDFGQSEPNYVTTYFSCDTGDTASTKIVFTKPVKNITLNGIGINGDAKVASFAIKHSDGSTETKAWIGAGDPLAPDPVDLKNFDDVKELAIVDVTDAYGIGFDDLAFDFPAAN